MVNYSCKKFSPTPYLSATIHPLQTNGLTDRWTDEWTTTHDNTSTIN